MAIEHGFHHTFSLKIKKMLKNYEIEEEQLDCVEIAEQKMVFEAADNENIVALRFFLVDSLENLVR